MASKLQLRRRIGSTGSPPDAGFLAGEAATAFANAAGANTALELWIHDGKKWVRANPPAAVPTVGNANLGGGTPGSKTGIGGAWTALGAGAPTDPIVIASFAGSAYVRTGAGGNDADWTSLGSAIQFADANEIHTGTETTKALNSAILRGETLAAPTGGAAAVPGDADRIVRLNPTGQIDRAFVSFTVQHETLGAGADVGAAWGAKAVTGQVVLADFGTPAKTYILVNKTAPGTAASWTLVGGAIDFADADDVKAGTDKVKALNSFVLQDTKVAVAVPTGAKASATDAGKLLRLDPNGQVSSKLLPVMPTNMRPPLDATKPFATVTPPYASGDIVFSTAGGNVGTGWAGAAGTAIKSGDAMLYDGTNWHVLPNKVDLSAYVPLAGTALMAGSIVWAADETGNDVLDLKQGNLQNAVIDCGTY